MKKNRELESLLAKTVPLYVVLYWVGSPNHPNSSIRSTGGYPRNHGAVFGPGGVEIIPPFLDQLAADLSKNGYSVRIVNQSIGIKTLKRLNPLPKERKPPKFNRPDKKARKAPKAAERISKYREVPFRENSF